MADPDQAKIVALEQRVVRLEQQLKGVTDVLKQLPALAKSQTAIAEQMKMLLAEGIIGAGQALGAALDEIADQGVIDRNRLILVLEQHLHRLEHRIGSGLDRTALEQVLGMLRVDSEAGSKPPGAGG